MTKTKMEQHLVARPSKLTNTLIFVPRGSDSDTETMSTYSDTVSDTISEDLEPASMYNMEDSTSSAQCTPNLQQPLPYTEKMADQFARVDPMDPEYKLKVLAAVCDIYKQIDDAEEAAGQTQAKSESAPLKVEAPNAAPGFRATERSLRSRTPRGTTSFNSPNTPGFTTPTNATPNPFIKAEPTDEKPLLDAQFRHDVGSQLQKVKKEEADNFKKHFGDWNQARASKPVSGPGKREVIEDLKEMGFFANHSSKKSK